jgi:hypothetical protein
MMARALWTAWSRNELHSGGAPVVPPACIFWVNTVFRSGSKAEMPKPSEIPANEIPISVSRVRHGYRRDRVNKSFMTNDILCCCQD